MARPSFADPQITNPILTDVSVIRELFTVLAKINPSLADGTPDGAIRLIATSSDETLWQLQRYKNGGWTTIGMLDHDVKGLGDYSVSTSAQPNTIPVYNSDAKLVGSITGNAETATKFQTPRNLDIGGIATATAQPFDGTADVTIPISSISVNNALDDAIIGVISKAHGGTGRNDGMADDVAFTTGAGATSAKATGQIGNGVALSGTTHLDSVIQPGHYGGGANWQNIGSPTVFSGTSILDVYRFDPGTIAQRFSNADNGEVWWRISRDNGANWGAWQPTTTSANVIYISKSGSDNNTGLDPAYPVLTFERAKQIAASSRAEIIRLRFGAGNWGIVQFGHNGIKATLLYIGAYTEALTNEYSTEFPVFSQGWVSFGASIDILSCVFDNLYVWGGSFVNLNPNFFQRVGLLDVSYGSTAIKTSTGSSIFEVNCLAIYDCANCIIFAEPRQWSNQTVWAHWIAGINSCLYVTKAPVSNSYSWTGMKYNIARSAVTNLTLATLETLTGQAGYIEVGACTGDGVYGIPLRSEVLLKNEWNWIAPSCQLNWLEAGTLGGSDKWIVPFSVRTADVSSTQLMDFYTYTGPSVISYNLRLWRNSTTNSEISLEYSNDTARARCPVPPAGDNTNSIATTSWVRARISEAISGLSSGGGGACPGPTTPCRFWWECDMSGSRNTNSADKGIATTEFVQALFGKTIYGMRPQLGLTGSYSRNTQYTMTANGYFWAYSSLTINLQILNQGYAYGATCSGGGYLIYPVRKGTIVKVVCDGACVMGFISCVENVTYTPVN